MLANAASVRRKTKGEQKWYRLGVDKSTWRRLKVKAGVLDTSVAELINRVLVKYLDAQGVSDPGPSPDEDEV